MMKIILLLLSTLLLAEQTSTSRLREGFKKIFKREPKKCDIIWTEQVVPQCETTNEKVCEEVYEDDCHTEFTEECKETFEEMCKTEFVTECKQEYEEICNTEYSKQCKTEYTQECTLHPHCEMVEEEACSTTYEKVCDNHDAAKMLKEWNGMAKKQKRHAPVAERLDAPEGGLDVIEEGDVAKKRMRRGDHLQRVLELVGMKKKEELCHHIPQKHCVIVPVERCHNVQECWQKPEERCWEEPTQTCHQEPRENCVQVPSQRCWQEPQTKCWQEPHKRCTQVLNEVCKEVPKEHCEYLPKLVAKKKCEKQKKFVERLRELVSW